MCVWGGGGGSGGKKNWDKIINIGIKGYAMVRGHAHQEKETMCQRHIPSKT